MNAPTSSIKSAGPRFGGRSIPWLAAAAFSALGLATSILLIPGDYERAMQEIEAGELDRAILRLQGMQAGGDISPRVAAALAFAQTEEGDLPAALDSLEAIARARPNDMSILAALADLYLGAGRLREHAEILERQQLIRPEKERLEEIVARHEELGQVERQRAALWTLVHSYKTDRDRYLDLARLEAADGEVQRAIEVLDLQEEAYPNSVDEDAVSLAVTLDLTQGKDRDALARSRDWLNRQAVFERAIQTLADVFQTQGRPDLLIALAEPLAVDSAPLEVFEVLAEAYYRSGDGRAASSTLARLGSFSASRPQVEMARLRVAYAISDPEEMLAAARELPIEAIPDFMLRSVVKAASGRQDAAYLRPIVGTAAASVFHRDPLIAAEVSIVLRDLDAARHWVEVALAQPEASPEVLLGAAAIDLQLGRPTRTLRTLRDLFGEPAELEAARPDVSTGAGGGETIPGHELIGAAGLYVRLGVPEEGRVALAAYRQAFPSAEADLAWALVSAASRARGEVRHWQVNIPKDQALPPEYLDLLAGTAMKAGAFDLAASVASRLVAARGSDADKMLMAQAMLAASRPLSLPALRPRAVD